MQLRVLLPTRILVDRPVAKVTAEGSEGQFCLLPRHVDYIALIVPGILLYEEPSADTADTAPRERYLAVDEGVLVKQGPRVEVALRDAVQGRDLGELHDIVERRFHQLDEHQRQARSALARLEAGVVRRFMQLEEQ